ncbi:cytochrome c oxidase assembly protein [Microbacterium sp. MMO-10]|uniref:cytochrome c oxidase assembly protein n=1 Tax=Microbacterium sp. MMO-10 TaxID=3081272 RepID=UPI0030180789
MPPIPVFLGTWSVDPAALVVLVTAAGLYLGGVAVLRRRGHRWPLRLTLMYLLLGLGSYAVVSFGFLGTWSPELRWAFSTRIALLLFVVPVLITLGRPVSLARAVLSAGPRARVNGFLRSWLARFFGNAIMAPVFTCLVFSVFFTPLSAVLRFSPVAEGAISALVPVLGLLMVLPMAAHTVARTSLFIVAEFLFAFVELVLDAIPGVLLRLGTVVFDQAGSWPGTLPLWFPNPLRDQQLSGDFLWFIAEIVDVPILVILMMRWIRSDRRESRSMDELSDEEMAELTAAHLRGE